MKKKIASLFLFVTTFIFSNEKGEKIKIDEKNNTIENKIQPIEDDRIFPIFGKQAKEKGYILPKPYGINFIYVDMKQNVNINSLDLNGELNLKGFANGLNIKAFDSIIKNISPIKLDKFITIKADVAESTNTNNLVRADVWIFPFLNVYGVIGKTKGKSVAKISNSVNLTPVLKPIVNEIAKPEVNAPIKDAIKDAINDRFGSWIGGIIGGFVDSEFDNLIQNVGNKVDTIKPIDFNTDFTLDYEGFTYGGGMVLAGGYKNIFSLVDINYTRTRLDIIEGEIAALVISPKLGVNFNIRNTKNSIWIGSMYQDITQTLKGNISDVFSIPGIEGKFKVSESSSSPWNSVLGFRSEINQTIELTTEISLNKKKTFMFAVGYRF